MAQRQFLHVSLSPRFFLPLFSALNFLFLYFTYFFTYQIIAGNLLLFTSTNKEDGSKGKINRSKNMLKWVSLRGKCWMRTLLYYLWGMTEIVQTYRYFFIFLFSFYFLLISFCRSSFFIAARGFHNFTYVHFPVPRNSLCVEKRACFL